MRNHDNVSVSFPARKSKFERKIAMKTWAILNTTNLFNCFVTIFKWKDGLIVWNKQMYQIFRTKDQTPAMWLKVVRLISYSSQTKSGTPPPPLLLRLLDSLMIVNVLTKFEKNLSGGFFSGEWP